jgi:RNA polymerase sigma-70 factor (ECF subfamily)
MSDRQPDPNELPTLSTGLLEQVRGMDPEGWSRMVTTFGPIVYRWCRCSGVSEHDAPDVVQEVFASVARGIPGFVRQRQHGSFRSWLATITRNRIRDYLRRRIKIEQAAGGSEALERLLAQEQQIDSTICGEQLESSLARAVLQVVKSEFQPVTWQAFWQTVVDGRSAADVAADLRLSLDSVYQAKSRVLRKLRQRLQDVPFSGH